MVFQPTWCAASSLLLIYNLRRPDHVTDALISLHWMRISERIIYKIAVLTYTVLQGAHRGTSDLLFVSPIFLVDKLSALLVPAAWWCHLSSCLQSVTGLPSGRPSSVERSSGRHCFCAVAVDFPSATQNLPLPSILPPSHHLFFHLNLFSVSRPCSNMLLRPV